jgi:aryl-alcohol dehydrogenase (NADP+)
MDYNRLGSSGLKVSRLWLGGMSFGDPKMRAWVVDETQSRRVLAAAIDHGINVIDTCDVYCDGISEQIIGRHVKESAVRDNVVLATKFGWRIGGNKGVNQAGYSRKYVIEACERSLRNLQTDYIDLYQTHIWDPNTNIEELVLAFDRLVQDGKIRYAGVADMPAWQFAKALYGAKAAAITPFVSVQHHYNAVWREDERELMPLCRAEGVGLVPYSPLGRGFLAGASETTRSRSDDRILQWYGRDADRAVAAEIKSIADEQGRPSAAVALGWVLDTPGVVSTVVGIRTPSQLDELLANLNFSLSAEERARIEKSYAYRKPQASH